MSISSIKSRGETSSFEGACEIWCSHSDLSFLCLKWAVKGSSLKYSKLVPY